MNFFDPGIIDETVKKISESLPNGLKEAKKEFETNTKAIIAATLNKLDLVTREEFDVQKAVLLRTREKIEALESQVRQLEEKLKQEN